MNYKTKIESGQYFYASMKAIVFFPLLLLFFLPKNPILEWIGIISFVCFEIYIFLYHLKTYELNDFELIIRKPFLRKEYVFKIDRIKEVKFYLNSSSFAAGNYVGIRHNNDFFSFSLLFYGNSLKEFMEKLKESGINVKNNLRIKL